MANPTSYAQGKTKLIEPEEFGYVDAWAPPLNSNFGVTDAALSGTTFINVNSISSNNPTVTLVFKNFSETAQPWSVPNAGQNLRIAVVGTLAFDVTVIIPKGTPGLWIFQNATTGNFNLFVRTDAVGGNYLTLPQNYMTLLFCDGTYTSFADQGVVVANTSTAVYPGTISAFGGPTAPDGYLACLGQAVPRSTYAALFAAIGTTWGVGNGNDTFNVPNLQGAFLRGAGAGLNPSSRTVGSYEADDVKPHTHAVTDPGHLHAIPTYGGRGPDAGNHVGAYDASAAAYPDVNSRSATTGITVVNSTGVESVPKNYAVLYIIKT